MTLAEILKTDGCEALNEWLMEHHGTTLEESLRHVLDEDEAEEEA